MVCNWFMSRIAMILSAFYCFYSQVRRVSKTTFHFIKNMQLLKILISVQAQ